MSVRAIGSNVAGRGGPVADARMTRDTQRFDRVAQTLSRRQALAGGAALLTAGGTLVVVGEPAAAAGEVSEFTVADKEFTRESVEPVVDVTAAFDYDVGTAPIDGLRFELGIDGTTVTTETMVTTKSTYTGEVTLSGAVPDSDAWSAGDLEPAIGASVERTLSVTLTFAVVDSNDEAIVSDSASDDPTVGVAHPQDSAYVVRVGGSGTIRASSE